MIKNIPKSDIKFGSSFIKNAPKISPTTALYELTGPKTDSSPRFSALIKKAFPSAPNIPPQSAQKNISKLKNLKHTIKSKGNDARDKKKYVLKLIYKEDVCAESLFCCTFKKEFEVILKITAAIVKTIK